MKVSLYDRWIVFPVLVLMSLGLLMVASSSMVISDQQFGYPFYYLIQTVLSFKTLISLTISM